MEMELFLQTLYSDMWEDDKKGPRKIIKTRNSPLLKKKKGKLCIFSI